MDLLPSAITISQLISAALSSTKSARELAKDSSDSDLKEQISQIYDSLLELKERVIEQAEENRLLKLELEKKRSIEGPIPPFGYYFQAGDREHPLCPKCFQERQPRQSFLSPATDWNGGFGVIVGFAIKQFGKKR
jgi:hypothetical protein